MAEIKAQKGKIQQNAQKYQEKLDLEYNKSNQLNLAKILTGAHQTKLK